MSATEEVDLKLVQYVPFSSFVNPSFWHTLTEQKLNVDKLSVKSKTIHGKFTYRADIGPIVEFDGVSLNKEPQLELDYIYMYGQFTNSNTVEEFKECNKVSLINTAGDSLWTNVVQTRDWISNPSSLLHFILISFADLKKFYYYYWFAFLAPSQPLVLMNKPPKIIDEEFDNAQIAEITKQHKSLDCTNQSFCIIIKTDTTLTVNCLSEYLSKDTPFKYDVNYVSIYFAFADPSNGTNPGWSLRIFIAALLEHSPELKGNIVKFIGLRSSHKGDYDKSMIFNIKIPENCQSSAPGGWVGWERNEKDQFAPKFANMSVSMDPVKLADTTSDLNIKLMKWRLVPTLDIDIIKNTKCLLLGAGTLGCHVARNLLAWGFRNITFVDNGKVSFSNPSRQVLYTFKDCIGKGKSKAAAAAENLKLILPTVNSKGLQIHIPMPGHPIGASLQEESMNHLLSLTEAILEHDIIFLLLDSREARWLPTMLGSYYGKIVINAALGFDSYLVMRHGVSAAVQEETAIEDKFIWGSQLGCYFCNDVTAPGNSQKDRTLDQQCTVTRPGAAAIAGALAVELLVSILQHPNNINAPAVYNVGDSQEELPPELQCSLGSIPHTIRGFLHSYQQVTPTCPKFNQCIACSSCVLERYREEGVGFLLNVFNGGTYLEDITGLSELKASLSSMDLQAYSDDEENE